MLKSFVHVGFSNCCGSRLLPVVLPMSIRKHTHLCVQVVSVNRPWFQWQYIGFSGISLSVRLYAKDFVEHENNFAHQVMEKNPSYASTILLKGNATSFRVVNDVEFESLVAKDWSSETASSIYEAFQIVSHFCSKSLRPITDQIFDGLCNSLIENKSDFTDTELAGILYCLSLWPQTDTLNCRNFGDIWSALDKECKSRVKQWDNEKLLYFADHWYSLHLLRFTEYTWYCTRKLTMKPKRLTPTQLVQCMFYVNASRKLNPAISMFEFEHRMENCVDELTIDELAILAMGYFKSQTKIRNLNVFTHMIQRATAEVDSVNEISLCALIKAFRFSLPLTHTDMLRNLLDKLVPNVARLSLLCCVHIALAGTNSQVFHEVLLQTIAQRFADEIKSVRLKDVERLAFALTLFDFDPKTTPCIYDRIVQELQSPTREEEIRKYPKCLVSCLQYLSLKNIYLEPLISQILDEEFISRTYGKNENKIQRDILCLDTSVAIECPSYSGNRLSTSLRRTIGKNNTHRVPVPESRKKLSATDAMMLDVLQTLEVVLEGPQYVYAGNILPSFQRADMVCGLRGGQAVAIPASFYAVELGDVRYPPADEAAVRWLCLVAGGWNCYVRESDRLLGSTAAKMRQLRRVGYHPVVIPWFEWIKVPTAEKQEYLRSKIIAS